MTTIIIQLAQPGIILYNDLVYHIDGRLKRLLSVLQVCSQEFDCLKKRRRKSLSRGILTGQNDVIIPSATCTQAERDRKYGPGWPWNTRICNELPTAADKKECRREKRRRCADRKRAEGLTRQQARASCREKKATRPRRPPRIRRPI